MGKGPAHGASLHVPGCECPRCKGFAPGNGYALKHGAKAAPFRFAERTSELEPYLAAIVPVYSDADAPLVSLAALTLARLERAEQAARKAEQAGDEDVAEPRAKEVRSWISLAARLLDQLGCSPRSRAKLGLDLTRASVLQEEALERLSNEGRRIRSEREAFDA